MKINFYWYKYAVVPNLEKVTAWLLKDKPMPWRILDAHRDMSRCLLYAAEQYAAAVATWEGKVLGPILGE